MGKTDNQFEQSKGKGLTALQNKLIGPDYNYSAQIRAPAEMGMSSRGDFNTLGDNIGGLLAYVNVLVTGEGKASKTGEPLGTQFFLDTPVKCKDIITGKDVVRSIYINNIPDGSIPFISTAMQGGATVTKFKGLVPGVMSNLSQINPLQILQAFSNGSNPACQRIRMPTVDSKNVKGFDSRYVTNSDIDNMNPAWFPNGKPDTNQTVEEGFTSLQSSPIDYSDMPDDLFIKLYYSSLGLLGLYIFLRMLLRGG